MAVLEPDGGTADAHVLLGTPVTAAGAKTPGVVEFEVSMSAVLAAAIETDTLGAGYALVVDAASGAVLADSRGASGTPGGPSAAGSTVIDAVLGGILDRADRAWTSLVVGGWGVGLAAVPGLAPGAPGWTVVVAEPMPGATTPLGLLAALGVLTLVLVGLGWWMSSQVLRPARVLERSRAEIRELYEAARNEALRDPLTGIGNQRAFAEELDRNMEFCKRNDLPLALLLIDLDDFKSVNDRLGHPAGDGVLVQFVETMRASIRASDRAFRIGGDEFAVVMPGTTAEGAEVVARRLLGRALATPATASDPPPASFSGGIAGWPEHGRSRAELYARADAALYWCKRHGRTSVEAFNPARHRVNPALGSELSGAVLDIIERGALRIVFQPIVRLADGAVVGYEALSRPHSDAFSDAGSFFSAAQTSGRILEVDTACLALVLAAASDRVPVDRLISLNLSPVTLEAPEFSANRLHHLLERHNIDPRRVIVELTERDPVDDLERVQANVEALKRLGVSVAADDVGAGNSGLQLLSQVRFDIVKIDISLVHEAARRRPSLEVMRSLVAIAHNWGALVVAEGVETAQQLQVVRELGVDTAQGYLLGRPAETCELERVDLESILAAAALPPSVLAPVAAPATVPARAPAAPAA